MTPYARLVDEHRSPGQSPRAEVRRLSDGVLIGHVLRVSATPRYSAVWVSPAGGERVGLGSLWGVRESAMERVVRYDRVIEGLRGVVPPREEVPEYPI